MAAWATTPRLSGDYYCVDYCKRCLGKFYTYAMKNVAFQDNDPAHRLCPWCKGECTAAQQEYHNLFVENLPEAG